MALLYILTGHHATDQVMRNLDLSYMSAAKYGKHIEQQQGHKPEEATIETSEEPLHVLAHGDKNQIAGQSGKDFAGRLIATFDKKQLSHRTILLYACNIAEGGHSVLEQITEELKKRGVRKAKVIGSVDQTFTMTNGTMRVLKQSQDAEALSKAVEGEHGDRRNAAAEPYLRPVGHGWNGFRIDGDGHLHGMSATDAGNEVPVFHE